MRFEKTGKDTFDLWQALVKGGFTIPMALGLVSQFLQHLYMQEIIREEQEFKILVKDIK